MLDVVAGDGDHGGGTGNAFGDERRVVLVEDVLGVCRHGERHTAQRGRVSRHLGGRGGEVGVDVVVVLAAGAVGDQPGLQESPPRTATTAPCGAGECPPDGGSADEQPAVGGDETDRGAWMPRQVSHCRLDGRDLEVVGAGLRGQECLDADRHSCGLQTEEFTNDERLGQPWVALEDVEDPLGPRVLGTGHRTPALSGWWKVR